MSTYARRGRILELAIERAAQTYRAEGRALLVRQRVPQALVGGKLRPVGKAPIDFLGVRAGGRSLVLEAKQVTVTDELPIDRFDDDQRAALATFHALGAEVLVVVGFLGRPPVEVYVVEWPALAAFLRKPPRQSIPRSWCRAHGLVAPTVCKRSTLRRVLFLDGREHPERKATIAGHVEEIPPPGGGIPAQAQASIVKPKATRTSTSRRRPTADRTPPPRRCPTQTAFVFDSISK